MDLETRITEAQEKVQELAQREQTLSKQLASARELLIRWDARLVTLKELAAEAEPSLVEEPEPLVDEGAVS